MIQGEGARDDNEGETGTCRKEVPEKSSYDARQRTTERGIQLSLEGYTLSLTSDRQEIE